MSHFALLPDDPHDAALLRHVHPPAWRNPVLHSRYDLVVLGAGPAGLVCAAGAAGLGARVALVERGLSPSREQARRSIMAGQVRISGRAARHLFDRACKKYQTK